MKKFKKNLLKIIAVIVILCLIGAVAFYVYALNYMKADSIAMNIAEDVYVKDGNYLMPGFESGELYEKNIGIIFYPGAKVEAAAYLPLFDELRLKGVNCIVVSMPLRFAFFDTDKADDMYEEFPEVEHWYISGHSLGGAMASSYASNNQDKVEGLILIGAYVYGDYPKDKALVIYGSNDLGLDRDKIYTESTNVEIIGGNHAGFGNYGVQKGDGELEITREVQQEITVINIVKYLKNK